MMRALLVSAAAVALFAGCAEKPQQLGNRVSPSGAYQGPASPGFSTSGWKAGDRDSWEGHMRARMQGQNEYSRAPTN